MSDAYVREQQNNALLDALAQKTNALKSVTVDIYDHARDHSTIENTSEVFSSLSTNIRGSAGRLTRMARQGDRIAVLKIAGIVIAVGFLLWIILSWIF
ncbi:blocked early in transport 1 [[Emmonsia] crescens]|uniref:Blocked early in transport 1 n=1 Tax=[Emmonsia] crescens TaxID=73230 RepID=A0A0G2IY31_9EURO|nr:blocked early in transport 1 [Emmonsia crescens UAMH 3008]